MQTNGSRAPALDNSSLLNTAFFLDTYAISEASKAMQGGVYAISQEARSDESNSSEPGRRWRTVVKGERLRDYKTERSPLISFLKRRADS